MTVTTGFTELQQTVDVPADALAEARRRRRVFRDAFRGASDVIDAWGSGSLARSTHKDPIHDVDIVVIFDPDEHSTWGEPGESAVEALEHTRTLAKNLLGPDGSEGVEIRHTLLRNHAVQCFLDDPDDPDAFTVDLTPALERREGGIWIPEQLSKIWVPSDPKRHIELVADRQREWSDFRPLARVLKRWNVDHGKTMKSLVVEVLALEHLPAGVSRPVALQRFFAAAAEAVLDGVCDPAGLTGEIDPDMDRYEAKKRLEDAGSVAWRAVSAKEDGDDARAMCLWREVFGDIYPEPGGGCGQFAAATAATTAAVVNIAPARRPVRDAPQG